MATAFRPEFSTDSSILGRHFRSPTMAFVQKANLTLTYAKTNRYVVRFRPRMQRLLVHSDSAGLGVKGTQGGQLFCGSDLEGNHHFVHALGE